MYAIRRELYWKYPVGETIQDDILMTLKVISAGYDFVYDTRAFSHEEPTASNDEWKRKRIQVSNLGTLRYVKEFLNPFAGFTAFALWSHKILRWFSPHLLILVIISNMFLLNCSPIFILSIYSIAVVIFDGNSWLHFQQIGDQVFGCFCFTIFTVPWEHF